MRYLLISDIHANLAAFEAVLKDAKGKYDKVWCLGDMVGYGPDPNECVELLLTLDHLCLSGNHDWAVLGKMNTDDFNPAARWATDWTQLQLNEPVREYLANRPIALVEERCYTLVHASPRHPIWEYILTPSIAQPNFDHFQTPYCFVGHTHIPAIYEAANDPRQLCAFRSPEFNQAPWTLGQQRLIINPGSVGQPRDGDVRAAYAILDLETNSLDHRRVPYPINLTQQKMKQHQFPPRLWQRLAFGE